MKPSYLFFGAIALLVVPYLTAEEITLFPSHDATLYQEGDTLQNGLGPNLFVGFTNGANARRTLLSFDIGGNLPADAIVRNASLTMTVNRAPGGFAVDQFGLHRVTQAWEEGTIAAAREGRGEAGGSGATWNSTGIADWDSDGGDFVEAASSSVLIGGAADYTWESTPELVSDVQAWIDDPELNFGWALLGRELERRSAKRISSVQHPEESQWPTLRIEFERAAGLLGDFDNDGLLLATDVDLLCEAVRSQGDLQGFDLNGDGSVDREDQRVWIEDIRGTFFGDADLNGVVNFADFLVLSSNFGQTPSAGSWQTGDYDCSGDVLFPDFLLLSENFGSTTNIASLPEASGLQAVPEPDVVTLFLLGGFVGMGMRRSLLTER